MSAISPSLIALNAGFERAQDRSAQALEALTAATAGDGEGLDTVELVKQVLAVRESQVAVLALASVERAHQENTKALLDVLA